MTKYYVEELNNKSGCTKIRIDKVIVERETDFQTIRIYKNNTYGLFLVLDDIQFAETDEYKYHEPLVHPAMLLHPNPKEVFILGGGDGLAAREVLKHPGVEKIYLVDIDGEMINVSKKYFGELNQRSLENPKVNIVIDDVRNFVNKTTEKVDIAIMDLPDISDSTEFLYTSKQIQEYKKVLKKDGIFVTHAQTINPVNRFPAFSVYWLMKQSFKYVYLYKGAHVASFFDEWYFVVGSDTIPVNELNMRDEQDLWDKLKLYGNRNELKKAIQPLKDVRTMVKKAEEYVRTNGFKIENNKHFYFMQEVTKSYVVDE